MKKFGTPSGAGPGSDSEYVGLRGDGTPLPLGSFGAGLRWREAPRPRLRGEKAWDDCGSEWLRPSGVGAEGAAVAGDVVVELVVDEDDELEAVVDTNVEVEVEVEIDVCRVVDDEVVVVVVVGGVVPAVVGVVDAGVEVVVVLVDDDAVVPVVVWDCVAVWDCGCVVVWGCVVVAGGTEPVCGGAGAVVARARSAPPARVISASAQQHSHVLQH